MNEWTQELKNEIREQFSYDGEAGTLTRVGGRGIPKNYLPKSGIVSITAGGKYWQLQPHRICWFLATGEEPENFIKLKDGNAKNLKFSNFYSILHLRRENRIRNENVKPPECIDSDRFTLDMYKQQKQEEEKEALDLSTIKGMSLERLKERLIKVVKIINNEAEQEKRTGVKMPLERAMSLMDAESALKKEIERLTESEFPQVEPPINVQYYT